ncbi:hypothetical protein [Amycolatopsis sp. NPDC051071]|uniref:hypothetical protein n=1 Tax=Amycolatopsis sp. NPDC051071 TaxID=3154637 RepID=UPI00341F3CCA
MQPVLDAPVVAGQIGDLVWSGAVLGQAGDAQCGLVVGVAGGGVQDADARGGADTSPQETHFREARLRARRALHNFPDYPFE